MAAGASAEVVMTGFTKIGPTIVAAVRETVFSVSVHGKGGDSRITVPR